MLDNFAGTPAPVPQEQRRIVITGSSNAVHNTWQAAFLDVMGWGDWTVTNRAVGGSSYTGTNSFLDQLTAARTSLGAINAANVSVVIIADASNNIRAKTNSGTVSNAADDTFAYARTAFPNARVVCLPVIWPANAREFWPAQLGYGYPAPLGPSLWAITEQLRRRAAQHGVEFVEDSWTWLTGHAEWMMPGEVHPNADGYAQVAYSLAKHFRGETTSGQTGHYLPAYRSGFAPSGADAFRGRLDGMTVHLYGAMRTTNGTNGLATWCELPLALRPETDRFVSGRNSANQHVQILIYTNGEVRVSGQTPAGTVVSTFDSYQLY